MKRVLIANRGEIALRAARACRKNGLETVAVYSTADAASPHVFAADRSVCIGPPPAKSSYLSQSALLEAAAATACDAIYPGYGFLAENAAFVDACEARGLKFIGPSAQAIRTMGDKSMARESVARLGVPVVPGSRDVLTTVAEARRAAEKIGFPILIKATAGGGGRGMRIARGPGDFDSLFVQAGSEAAAAFGNGALYLERFMDRVRHIEIQVFGDSHGNYRHLWERDCSVQRRHQKMIEEAPSPVLEDATRRQMTEAAVAIAEAIRYENAGTVEFVYDISSGRFFFIEMNTRIQVEHPVTEMITGADLVVEQLRVAAGRRLSLPARKARPGASAIEFRICAEDPSRDFAPCPGRILSIERPDGAEVRFDSHVYPGYEVPPFYDSMIGKLIVSGESRHDALANAARALLGMKIDGVPTTIPFHRRVLRDPRFVSAEVHTRWVEQELMKEDASGEVIQNGRDAG